MSALARRIRAFKFKDLPRQRPVCASAQLWYSNAAPRPEAAGATTTSNGSTSTSRSGAESSKSQDSLRDLALRGRILSAAKKYNLKEAMQHYADAEDRNMVLDTGSFAALLSACVQPLQKGSHVPTGVATRQNVLAMKLYDALLASGQLPSMEIFNNVSKAVAMSFDDKGATRIAKHLEEQGLKPSPQFRANIVQAHARKNFALAYELYESMKEDGVRVRAFDYVSIYRSACLPSNNIILASSLR